MENYFQLGEVIIKRFIYNNNLFRIKYREV